MPRRQAFCGDRWSDQETAIRLPARHAALLRARRLIARRPPRPGGDRGAAG